MFKYFLIIFLLIDNKALSANIKQKVCIPKLIKNYENIQDNLKICDKGDRIIIQHKFNLSSEILMGKICDLRYQIIFDNEKEKILKPDANFVCIYLPEFTN